MVLSRSRTITSCLSIVLFSVACCWLAAGSVASAISFNPVDDTMIWRDYNDPSGSNESSLEHMSVDMRADIDRFHRTLLQFDLSGVAPGTQIGNATLSLYALTQSEYKDNVFVVNRVTEAWEGDVVTWTDATSSQEWSTAGGVWTASGESSVLIPNKYGTDWHQASGAYDEWIDWDVTQIVLDWIVSGESNFGLLVRQEYLVNSSENQHINFASIENGDSSLKPVLVLTIIPEPSTAALLALGLVGIAAGRRR